MPLAGRWRLEVLGEVAVVAPDGARTVVRGAQTAAVLAMLWSERRPVQRDELAALLWGEDTPLSPHWAGAIRGVLSKARATVEAAGLGKSALVADAGVVRLVTPPDATTDHQEMAEWVALAASARSEGRHPEALRLATAAAERGASPVALTCEGEWLRHLRLKVATYAGEARHLQVGALIDLGRLAEAIPLAESAIATDPLDETAYGQLIRALLAADRPVAAQRTHSALAEMLRDELGIAPDPSLAVEIAAWQPGSVSPSAKPSRGANGLLGRSAELEQLNGVLEEVRSTGRPAYVQIEGPAGIGKTKLAEVFASTAGCMALWGRCHADSGVAFEPLADAFRRAIERDGLLGSDAPPELVNGASRLVPDLFEAVPAATRSMRGEDRAAVLRDVAAALAHCAAAGPLVLVVDDLHWAASDSLALITGILESVDRPVLLVGTVREGVSESAGFADLLRAAPVTVQRLAGVQARDLVPLAADLIAVTGDERTVDELSEVLHRRTGGLPYYVVEVAAEARRRRTVDETAMPPSARAWVSSRVDALSDELASLLEVAAALGPRPALTLIEACWPGPARRAEQGIDRLMRAGFLADSGDAETVVFPHEITREAVAERVGQIRQTRLHARAAEHLIDRSSPGTVMHAELTRHLALAGEPYRRAWVEHSFAAAIEASQRGAWDLADAHLLGALDRCTTDEVTWRAALLVARGTVLHARGDLADALACLEEAASLAAIEHDACTLARATIQMVGRAGRGAAVDMPDHERVARLRTALDALADWEAPSDPLECVGFEAAADARALLQTIVEVELAWALLFAGSFEEREELLTATLKRVRRSGAGPAQLAQALVAQRNILHGPGAVPARLRNSNEVFALDLRRVPYEISQAAILGRHEDLLVVGDRPGADEVLRQAEVKADAHGQPYWLSAVSTWRSLARLIDGDPDAAEAALQASGVFAADRSREAAACRAVQLVCIRLFQGRSAEVVDLLAGAVHANPRIPCYRAVLALCCAAAGDMSGAAGAYERFRRDEFRSIPNDSNRLLTVASLGDVAVTLGDRVGAELLAAQLLPDDGLHVVLNCYGGGGAYWGPVSRVLADIWEMLGQRSAADDARTRALKEANAMQSGAALALVRGEIVERAARIGA